MDLDAVIDDLVIGDDYDILRTVTEVPDSTSLDRGWISVKINRTDPDSAAIIFKEITVVEQSGIGQIIDEGSSDGTAMVLFQLTHAETLLLYEHIAYVYDIKVRTATNKIHTAESGLLYPVRGVTEAV